MFCPSSLWIPTCQDCTRGVRRLGSNMLIDCPENAKRGNVPVAGKLAGSVFKDCNFPFCKPASVTQPPGYFPGVVYGPGVQPPRSSGSAKIFPSIPGFPKAMLLKLLKPSRV